MILNQAYNIRIWPSFLSVFLMLGLAIYATRRRNIPGVVPFIITNLFGAVWMAGSVMEHSSIDIAGKIFWIKFEAIWQLPAATGITLFVLEYTWPGRWVNRRTIALLSIAPLIVLGFIVSDNLHHLMWRGFSTNGVVAPQLGLVGIIAVAYSFILVILNISVFIWLFIHSPQHRVPVAIMVTGHVVFRTLFLFEKVRLIRSNFLVDEVGLVFIVLMYFIALFGFHIFDPIPVARQSVIEQLHDGMLVLDHLGRVTSMNPAAEAIFSTRLKQVRNKPVGLLFPSIPELSVPFAAAHAWFKPIDLKVGSSAEIRHFEMEISPLHDFRKLPVGHLLLMHDVTEQLQAQTQIVKQQRSLAKLQEREHLARELHDELAQDLALINLQAQLVSSLLDSGQAQQAQAQLQILAQAAREAHIDVRGEISTLSNNHTQEKGFLGALKCFMDTFEQTYQIETELIHDVTDQKITFAPAVEVQLLRIVQEAFTNIRKHARAKHAKLYLMTEPECIKLIIVDDGVGFPTEGLQTSRQTFGLGIMSSRAEEINGRVEVESETGKGTKVSVIIPVDGEH